ncbi:MAG: SNF2 helicase associated domain-containing protein [Desulfovibrionaceae bacterium]|nr:SNF2 helicase associated domain-containing protein [Desulfovibrionaceae bacterium]
MNRREEIAARSLAQTFVDSTLPEYIADAGREILSEGGVGKFTIRAEGDVWVIEATVSGEDFQAYKPVLTFNLADQRVDSACNCMDSSIGPCRHMAAAALKFLASLAETEGAAEVEQKPRPEWRHSFRNFFGGTFEPETGRHYFLFRFYPEPGRLSVAFFRARQNKTGLSSVRQEITLEHILRNPEWCEYSPELPKVIRQIAQYLDYYGHRVEIPDGLLSWFFWAIRHEDYLYWKDSEIPCRIESSSMALKLRPSLDEDGLRFDVMLQREGKQPFSILDEEPDDDAEIPGSTHESATFHGQMPLWVCWNQGFYPVQTCLHHEVIQSLVHAGPVIPQEDIPEFLDRVWTRLPSSELYEQDEFLKVMEPVFQPATYNPKLFLDEEGSLLTLEVQNVYETVHGEFTLPGPNPDFQTGSYVFEGKTFLVRRNQVEENSLLSQLTDMRFQPRSTRLWFMEPEEAIAFLLDSYPSLVENWRVYGEATLSRYKVRASTPVVNAAVESNEKEKWFSLDIQVDYDGQNLPLERIWKAWLKGKRYVQLKDGSYASLPESWLEKLAHKLKVLGLDPAKPPKRQFKQFEAPVLDSLLEDLPGAREDSFWSKLRDNIRNFQEVRQIAPPAGLNAELRPYQLQGVSYLNFLDEYGFGGILADEMGLGKTIQTLSFIQHMVNKGASGPNLIVVPTSVLPNWDREASRFVPRLSRVIVYGTRRESIFHKIADADLVITTYALLRRDLEELEQHNFNAIILDEAQNIKNPNTITARAVRNIHARMRLCLSGTPIENNLFELWSLFEFLMPGFLGSQHAFQRGVIKPIKEGDTETLEYLRSRVKPFILRRTKAEVVRDLPPKIESVTYCALAEEQAELYAALARKLRAQVLADVDQKGMAKSQMSILDALLKLRQICCHPKLLRMDMPGFNANMVSGKFEAFKDMIIDIVEEGHKVLVFSQFVQMLQQIRGWLQMTDIPFCYLDGSSKDRLEQVDRFNNSPNIPIFLISLKAGGTGLNLTSADYVIHYDPWWNPAVESQATDRAHRIGQARQVFSYKLICQNTVEEKILKLQDMKRGVAEAVIPGQDSWKSLTREDLEMLFEV